MPRDCAHLKYLFFCFFASQLVCVGALAENLKSPSEFAQLIGDAYGGFSKIKQMKERGTRSKCKASTMSGISDATNQFDCEVIGKGDKLRLEMEILGQKNILGYDGKQGWSQVGDWVCPSPETTVRRLRDELDHGLNALEYLNDRESQLEILPAKSTAGKLCDVLKLTPKNGKWTIFYADPASHLILKSEFMGHDNEQGIEVVESFEYGDYRPVDGVPTPFKVREFAGNKVTSETIIETVAIDDDIKDSLFEMPAETLVSGLNQGQVTVPFEYVGNEIVINARINGGQEGKFIVDSGASQTVLDKKAADEIGPYTVSSFNVTTGAKAVPLCYTKLQKVQIGNLAVENISALVSDLSSFGAAIGHRPSGLIGANILRRFFVTIDYGERKLILSDPNKVVLPEGAICIPTSPVFGATALVVNGLVDNKFSVNFLVDTGAAFNNLPQSLAKKLGIGSTISVGQIYGLDGQRLDIGAVKLKSLKLADFEVPGPVFGLQPETTSALPGGGLFRAGAMGIIGNPIWSKTILSIDYRNERLIVQLPQDQAKHDKLVAEINECEKLFLKNKNADEATRRYEAIIKSAQEQGQKSAEALAIAGTASCLSSKFTQSKDVRWLDLASREYDRASKLANEARNKVVEGQILGQWAMLCLTAPRSSGDLLSGQVLLQKSLSKAPMVGSTFGALGAAMIKSGKTQLAKQFINQALLLDPANWQALWAKYKLSEMDGKAKDQELVLAQLERYYPDFPQVQEAKAKRIKQSPHQAVAKRNIRQQPKSTRSASGKK